MKIRTKNFNDKRKVIEEDFKREREKRKEARILNIRNAGLEIKEERERKKLRAHIRSARRSSNGGEGKSAR